MQQNVIIVNEVYGEAGNELKLIYDGKELLSLPFDECLYNMTISKYFMGEITTEVIKLKLVKDNT